jgi:hypothetical protein
MEPRTSVPNSQQSTDVNYHDSDIFTSQLETFCWRPALAYFHLCLMFQSYLLPASVVKMLIPFSYSLCMLHIHPSVLQLIILVMFHEDFSLLSSPYNFIHPFANSSHWGPNILLSIRFWHPQPVFFSYSGRPSFTPIKTWAIVPE